MKIFLPIELEEVSLYDEKGNLIENIRNITSFKNGLVVMTEKGTYTNVKSLIKKRHVNLD